MAIAKQELDFFSSSSLFFAHAVQVFFPLILSNLMMFHVRSQLQLPSSLGQANLTRALSFIVSCINPSKLLLHVWQGREIFTINTNLR